MMCNDCVHCIQVSCGQCCTIAISKDGSQVFACGKSDNCAFGDANISGNHQYPFVRLYLHVFLQTIISI